MSIWYTVQIYISIDTGKTEEVLILHPAAGTPLEYHHSQFIFTRNQIRCQFKFRWGKRILAVTHIVAVAPQSHAAFHTLERDTNLLPSHSLRHFKIFHIASYRIKAGRNLTWHYILVTIPRILHIHIHGSIIALHLQMCRHRNHIPVVTIIICPVKTCRNQAWILCIEKLPMPLQAFLVTGFLPFCLALIPINHMIRMCRKTIFFIECRITDQPNNLIRIKLFRYCIFQSFFRNRNCFHVFPPTLFFSNYHIFIFGIFLPNFSRNYLPSHVSGRPAFSLVTSATNPFISIP